MMTSLFTFLGGNSRFLLAATCCAMLGGSLAGCRHIDNAQVDVMERELRQQEDYIYELEDYLLEYSDKLRSYRCREEQMATAGASKSSDKRTNEKGSSRRPLAEPELADDTPDPTSDKTAKGNQNELPEPTDEPRESLPAPEPAVPEPAVPEPAAPVPAVEPAPEEMEIPKVEIGPFSSTGEEPARQLARTDAPQSDYLVIPDPAAYQSSESRQHGGNEQSVENETEPQAALTPEMLAVATSDPEATAAPARMNAEQLEIRRLLANDADQTESQGLLVVVEALNELREPVDVEGELSLMVLTSEGEQTPQRVQRWDFTPEDAIASWQSSPLGDGLHLELPLTAQNLPSRPLELWARLITADGRKLITKRPFQAEQLATLSEAEAEFQLVDDKEAQEHFAEQDSRLFEASQRETPVADEVYQAVAEEPVVDSKLSSDEELKGDGWRGSSRAASARSSGVYVSTKQNRTARWSAGTPARQAPEAEGSVNPLRTAVRENRSAEPTPARWQPFD